MTIKTSICILCVKPHQIWLDFLNTFTQYDIYLVVDDNSKDYKDMYKYYTNIRIIQIPNDVCIQFGFINLTFKTIYKKVTAWDKALYYFSTMNANYNHVWFIEDDVFFYNEQTLIDIDSKYIHSDFLGTGTSYKENIDGKSRDWLWQDVHLKIPPPYYKCLCCVIRISKALFHKIKNYATFYKTLDFLEALFPTLCKQGGLQYDMPDEFANVIYIKDHDINTLNKKNLYHPLKHIKDHMMIRTTR